MIDMQQSCQLDERRLWSGHVRHLFQTLEIGGRAAAPDIAESLAVVCQQNAHTTKHALSLLMARSFCIADDAEAAGRILRHDDTHRPHADAWIEVLSSGYPFPELYPFFSSRALRPQRLTSAGTLWVLDLDRIQLTEADRHELIIFQTVRVLTEKVSNVWKKTEGRGTLGVKGLTRLTQFVYGRRTSLRLADHISDVLALCAQKNGWPAVPSVLLLDL